MKKNLLASLLLNAIGILAAQAQTAVASVEAQVIQTDSVIQWLSFSKEVAPKRNNIQKNYTYNAAGKLLSYEWWMAESPEESKRKIIYTYNTAGLVASETTQYKNSSGQYYNYVTTNYTYNGTGQLTEQLVKRYNSQLAQLQNYSRNKKAFNAASKLLSDSSFVWTNSAWQLADALTYTYTNNKMTSWEQYSDILFVKNRYNYLYNTQDSVTRVIQQSTPTSTTNWTNTQKDTVIYANGKRSEQIRYTINANNGQWKASSRRTFIQVGSVLTETRYYSTGASWDFEYKYESTYDASNRLVQYISQQYYGSTIQWRNMDKKTYTYNATGQTSKQYNYSWNVTTNAWHRLSLWDYAYGLNNQNTQTVHQIYSTTADTLTQLDSTINYLRLATVGVKPFAANKLKIYPNPSTGVFLLAAEMKMTDVAVYSVLGEKIYTAVASPMSDNNTMMIDLSQQPKGTYLMMVTDIKSGQVYIQRILLQ